VDEAVTLSGEFQVAKADDAERLVFGWASVSVAKDGSEVWDSDSEHIPSGDLEQAAYEFVLNSRESGTDHDGGPVRGQLVESLVTTVEKQERMGLEPGSLPVGWWVGFHVDDDDAWSSVTGGDRVMFSIEGMAQREEVDA
jgi:Putative phage serine protease XkdF